MALMGTHLRQELADALGHMLLGLFGAEPPLVLHVAELERDLLE
jgi:hypothetical protein